MLKNKLSVIVTIYNTPKQYLEKCLNSIINQTLLEIEIILINDGSNKEVSQICENYKKKDNRIKLIYQENQGESVARNIGIKNSTTNNITFVDSDDWIETNMCEQVYSCIQNIKNDFDILIFNCYVNYSKKQLQNTFYPKCGYINSEDIEQIQLQNIEKGVCKYYPPETNISVPWAKVYNKKFIESNNLEFVPKIIRMPDAIFNMEAFEKAKKIYVCEDYLYHYNKNDFSICQRYSKDTISYYETFIKFVEKYIQKYNKNEKFIDTLNLKIVTSIDTYMYNYFFHKDNPNLEEEIKREFLNILDGKRYVQAMENVKSKYLSNYQKLVLKYAKKKNYYMLKLLKKIKDFIKSKI